jgi:hypothetical protein
MENGLAVSKVFSLLKELKDMHALLWSLVFGVLKLLECNFNFKEYFNFSNS